MISFGIESIQAIKPEIVPLLNLHWRDAAMFDDMALDVNWPMYYELEKKQKLRTFTARSEDLQLAGYQVFTLYDHHHYKSHYVAQQMALFLHPDYRKGRDGLRFILYAEQRLKDAGVNMIMQHTKKRRDFSKLLERVGYEVTDTVLTKRL